MPRAPSKSSAPKAQPLLFSRAGLKSDGGWADAAAADVESFALTERGAWIAFFDHASTIRPMLKGREWGETLAMTEQAIIGFESPPGESSPTPPAPGSDGFVQALRTCGPPPAWLDGAAERVAAIGAERFRSVACRWLRAVKRSSTGHLNRPGPNRELLRALIWACVGVLDPEVAEVLRQVASFATRHRTNQAMTAGAALALAESQASLSALLLLSEESSRPTPRKRFARLAEHVRLRLGISPEEAAEAHVPTYGFDAGGRIVETVGPARVELWIEGGNVLASWQNEKGKAVKSVPAAARAAAPDAVKRIKAVAADAEAVLASQRDRLDRLMRLPRQWTCGQWRERYVEHPLVRPVARRLVWLVDEIPVEVTAGTPRRVDGEPVRPTDEAPVRLWHPALRPADEVVACRRRLTELGVTQPFKQAHREVYLLTDAERKTATYSNRFAAHVLRQHPLAALARGRGWDYRLLGNWDSGDTGRATLSLPAFRLRAEFWVQGAGEATTEAGILLLVSTDQVRFYADGAGDPLPLDQVPPLALSEVMRDVDLFVGVASVGNDPTWQDGGPGGRMREYWEHYSFGELSATAHTRREVLADMLPRLKIRDRASLADRFLVVRGDLRAYKIHLGSGNILMEPNDQYLCIVASRPAPNAAGDAGLFLPFEGDSTLSLILSKALLLADDTKITDPSITRQINR